MATDNPERPTIEEKLRGAEVWELLSETEQEVVSFASRMHDRLVDKGVDDTAALRPDYDNDTFFSDVVKIGKNVQEMLVQWNEGTYDSTSALDIANIAMLLEAGTSAE